MTTQIETSCTAADHHDACVQPAPAQQSLPTTELTINGHRVTAEVATTVAPAPSV